MAYYHVMQPDGRRCSYTSISSIIVFNHKYEGGLVKSWERLKLVHFPHLEELFEKYAKNKEEEIEIHLMDSDEFDDYHHLNSTCSMCDYVEEDD